MSRFAGAEASACFFGGASLWLFPHNAVSGETWRWINLLLTPIAVGLCMSWMGAWRAKRAQTLFRIDRFSYGYLFALGFALLVVVLGLTAFRTM